MEIIPLGATTQLGSFGTARAKGRMLHLPSGNQVWQGFKPRPSTPEAATQPPFTSAALGLSACCLTALPASQLAAHHQGHTCHFTYTYRVWGTWNLKTSQTVVLVRWCVSAHLSESYTKNPAMPKNQRHAYKHHTLPTHMTCSEWGQKMVLSLACSS